MLARQLQEDFLQAHRRGPHFIEVPAGRDHRAGEVAPRETAFAVLYFKSASLRAFSLERHAAHSGNLLELFADRLRIERSVSRADLHKHGLRSAGAALQVAHRVRRYQSSFVDNDHLLAGLLDLRENVRAQNDGMVASKTLDQIPRLIDLLRIESRRGFVQNEYVGIVQNRLCQTDALAVAFR